MTIEDRIALTIGRLILDNENKAEIIAKQAKELENNIPKPEPLSRKAKR